MKTLYDGKTKTVLLNEDTGVVNLFFKDSATGENGYFDPGFNTVGGSVEGKGKIGLQISKHFFEIMEKNGIPTHYLGADVDKCLMQVRKLTVPSWSSCCATSPPAPCAAASAWRRASCSILPTPRSP